MPSSRPLIPLSTTPAKKSAAASTTSLNTTLHNTQHKRSYPVRDTLPPNVTLPLSVNHSTSSAAIVRPPAQVCLMCDAGWRVNVTGIALVQNIAPSVWSRYDQVLASNGSMETSSPSLQSSSTLSTPLQPQPLIQAASANGGKTASLSNSSVNMPAGAYHTKVCAIHSKYPETFLTKEQLEREPISWSSKIFTCTLQQQPLLRSKKISCISNATSTAPGVDVCTAFSLSLQFISTLSVPHPLSHLMFDFLSTFEMFTAEHLVTRFTNASMPQFALPMGQPASKHTMTGRVTESMLQLAPAAEPVIAENFLDPTLDPRVSQDGTMESSHFVPCSSLKADGQLGLLQISAIDSLALSPPAHCYTFEEPSLELGLHICSREGPQCSLADDPTTQVCALHMGLINRTEIEVYDRPVNSTAKELSTDIGQKLCVSEKGLINCTTTQPPNEINQQVCACAGDFEKVTAAEPLIALSHEVCACKGDLVQPIPAQPSITCGRPVCAWKGSDSLTAEPSPHQLHVEFLYTSQQQGVKNTGPATLLTTICLCITALSVASIIGLMLGIWLCRARAGFVDWKRVSNTLVVWGASDAGKKQRGLWLFLGDGFGTTPLPLHFYWYSPML